MRGPIHARHLRELELQLRNNSAIIPKAVAGRDNRQREHWQADRLLGILARLGAVDFPLESTLRDKPDCLLESAGRKIGIEITELVSSGLRDAQKMAENSGFDERRLDISRFTYGGPLQNASGQEIASYLAAGGTEPRFFRGYTSQNSEALFRAANDRVASKTLSMNKVIDGKTNYDLFDSNWLFLYASFAQVDDPIRFKHLVSDPGVQAGAAKFDLVYLLLADHYLISWPEGQVIDIGALRY